MEREEIIIKMDQKALRNLKKLFLKRVFSKRKPPKPGLLMMRVKDSFETDFYLGEILVTEAEVEYHEVKGYGMVIGDEPERALVLATLDAIFKSNDEALKQMIEDFLEEERKKIISEEEIAKKLIAKTKVNFEIMAKR